VVHIDFGEYFQRTDALDDNFLAARQNVVFQGIVFNLVTVWPSIFMQVIIEGNYFGSQGISNFVGQWSFARAVVAIYDDEMTRG
jgi:hypothetical protein